MTDIDALIARLNPMIALRIFEAAFTAAIVAFEVWVLFTVWKERNR